jgi:hypothetical protein
MRKKRGVTRETNKGNVTNAYKIFYVKPKSERFYENINFLLNLQDGFFQNRDIEVLL